MSSEDLLRSSWEQMLPVSIELASQDLIEKQSPPLPFYTLFSKIHYLSLYFEKLHEFFKDYILNLEEVLPDLDMQTSAAPQTTPLTMWLEMDGKPLSWNLPLGLQIDLAFQQYNENEFLPLKIVLHYRYIFYNRDYPKNMLPRSYVSDKNYYLYDLKQASCIKFQNNAAQILCEFPREKTEDLYLQYCLLQYDGFKKHFDQIFRDYKKKKFEQHKILPIRIYFQETEWRIQKAIKVENYTTLRQFIEKENLQEYGFSHFGITLDLQIEMSWIYEQFCSFDGFFTIVACNN